MLTNPSQLEKYQKLSRKGFSLVELLIAVGIFAFATSGLIHLFLNSTLLDQANRNKSIAVAHSEFVMENIMEYMSKNDINAFKVHIGDWYWDSDEIGSKLGCVLPYSYPCILIGESITTTYDEDPLFDDEGALLIKVMVTWKDRAQANTRDLSLETIISRR